MLDWNATLKRVLAVAGLAAAVVGSHGRASAVCATVRVQLSHEAVLTRSAFRASLEMSNSLDGQTLTGVRATLNVTREGDSTATTQNAAFAGATTPTVCTLDEDGQLPAGNSAKFEWLLVPGRDAAPPPFANQPPTTNAPARRATES